MKRDMAKQRKKTSFKWNNLSECKEMIANRDGLLSSSLPFCALLNIENEDFSGRSTRRCSVMCAGSHMNCTTKEGL